MNEKATFSLRGIVDNNKGNYTDAQRLHLIEFMGKRQANLYIWNNFSWESAYLQPSEEDIEVITILKQKSSEHNIELWVGMKPGDYRYCMHHSDRTAFRNNAREFLRNGADGIFITMDDTHPNQKVSAKDAQYQSQLIEELYLDIGDKLKAVCGEEYHGKAITCNEYWNPILKVLPKWVMVTWTGPQIWNRRLNSQNIPTIDWPILLWDNYFASDSEKPERAPIYPYDGRDASLALKVKGIALNLSKHYPWQFCALHTALDFLSNPLKYNPHRSFHNAVLHLGDNYWKEVENNIPHSRKGTLTNCVK